MSAYAGESARESGSASQKPYAHAGHACESARHSMGKTGPFRQFLCSKQHAKNNAQYAPLFENCPPLRRSRSRKNPWVSLWITAGGRVQCPHFQPNIHIVLMFSHSVKGFAGGGHNLLAEVIFVGALRLQPFQNIVARRETGQPAGTGFQFILGRGVFPGLGIKGGFSPMVDGSAGLACGTGMEGFPPLSKADLV